MSARALSAVGLIPAGLALLLPKCPLCLLPYLSVLGVSAGALGMVAGWWGPWLTALRVVAVGLLAASLVGWVVRRRRAGACPRSG